MDLTSHDLQRDVLDASLRFAHASGLRWWSATLASAWRPRRQEQHERPALGREVRPAGGGRSGGRTGCDHRRRELLSGAADPARRGLRLLGLAFPAGGADLQVDHPAVGVCLDAAHAASRLASSASTISGSAPPWHHSCATYTFTTTCRGPTLRASPPSPEHSVYGLGDLHLRRAGAPSRSGTCCSG